MSLRLILFGAPTIESGGQSLALPFERRSQLLVLLALRRIWVGRAELATTLWPDQATKLAYANLRKTLFRLQSVPLGAETSRLQEGAAAALGHERYRIWVRVRNGAPRRAESGCATAAAWRIADRIRRRRQCRLVELVGL